MLNISQLAGIKWLKTVYLDVVIITYLVASILVIVTAGLIKSSATSALTSFSADDLLGQLDSGNNPAWNQGDPYNNSGLSGTPDAKGMYRPQGTLVDTLRHRLFVSTCGARVLVYNLDASNNLLDRVADNVLGQTDFSYDVNPSTVDQSNLKCPAGMAMDEAGNRLFVADSYRNRVMVYNLTGGISNGMNAGYVLGALDFSTGQYATTQNRMAGPYGGLAYDPNSHYLYVSDSGNARVLVFDLSGSITNGMNALYVIGQPNFTSATQAITRTGMSDPYGMALDTAGHRLFIADDRFCNTGRVLVYDTSSLSNGMNASNVLGVTDFTAQDNSACNTPSASNMDPEGLAYDPKHQLLFVEDSGANRLLTFDVSDVSNGENAVGVIGQQDFISNDGSCIPSASTICYPEGLSDYYDITNNRLYFSDFDDNRVMIFNFAKLLDSLPGGTVGSVYSVSSLGSRTKGTVTYSVISGGLPPGLSINATNGSLTGTPSLAGTFNFTIKLTDNNGNAGTYSDMKSYALTITEPSGSSTASNSPSSSTATTSTAPVINLDNTSSFTSSTDSGNAFEADNLSAGQSLSFDLTDGSTEQHTVTIDKVTADSVSLTLRSKPIRLTLLPGQTHEVDVNSDGHDDIGLELVKITPPTASIKFWKVGTPFNKEESPVAGAVSPAAKPVSVIPSNKWLWLVVGVLGLVALVVMWWYTTKHTRFKQMPS